MSDFGPSFVGVICVCRLITGGLKFTRRALAGPFFAPTLTSTVAVPFTVGDNCCPPS